MNTNRTAAPALATATATVTVAGETRTITLEVSRDGKRASAPSGTFVGRIGAGQATYPANPLFTLNRAGEWAMGSTLIRNRPARVTGWADVAALTNRADQSRA